MSPMNGSPITGTGQGGMLEVTDLNGDGLDDLAIGSIDATSGGVRIRLAGGNGTWTQGPTLASGSPIGNLASGDFNSDGKQDLVVQLTSGSGDYSESDSFTVYPGAGDGTFGTPKPLPLPDGKVVIAIPIGQAVLPFDWDRNGKLDLVFGLAGGQIGVALGNGDGTFNEMIVGGLVAEVDGPGEGFSALADGDFNGDGKSDVALGMAGDLSGSTEARNTGLIILHSGPGVAYSMARVPGSPPPGIITRLVVTDLDGDSFDDLIASSTGSEDDGSVTNLFSYLGSEEGIAEAAGPTLLTLPRPSHVLLGEDFSGDGDLDLAWTDFPDSGASRPTDLMVAVRNGESDFGLPRAFDLNFADDQAPAIDVRSGDFNGDGAPDSAASFLSEDCAVNSCGVSVLLNRPDPVAAPASIDFGTITQTSSRPNVPLTVSNTGGAPLKVNQLLTAGPVALSGNCATILPGESCPLQVSIDASTVGDLEGSVWIAVQDSDQIEVPVKAKVVAPVLPPPPTYTATMKLTGPKKVKAGKKFKLNATVSNTGTGNLDGLTLKYKATQGKATKAQATLKLSTVLTGKKLAKPVAIAIKKRKLTRGKPLKVTVTLLRQGKSLASKGLAVKQDFGRVRPKKR